MRRSKKAVKLSGAKLSLKQVKDLDRVVGGLAIGGGSNNAPTMH